MAMSIDWDKAKSGWIEHRGKIIGTTVGLIAGLFIIRYGFWRTLLVAAFVGAGLWVGSLIDGEGWESLYDKVVRRGR